MTTPSEQLQRKLAAVLYADVAGYSRLTSADEEGTHRRLSVYLDLMSESIRQHGGSVVHYAGDAVLADFNTVTDALNCAVRIQEDLRARNADLPQEQRILFRVGVNLGEVIVDRDDIYGDGVNVAARLESLAEPGGISISQAVRTAAGNKLPFSYHDIGLQKVKNIQEPVHAYQVVFDEHAPISAKPANNWIRVVAGGAILASLVAASVWLAPRPGKDESQPAGSEDAQTARSTPEPQASRPAPKPSIAVLPFQLLSDDDEKEYFSDGITNDLITDLSKFSNLLVIASNSVFTYKGKAVPVKDVGRDLGVRYVLEGSVQKVGDHVRINAQLIDAATDHHIWADRYDFELGDIFRVQDEITSTVVTSLQVILTEDEQNRGTVHHTKVTEAYDLFLRGRTYLKGTRQSHLKARELFDRAIELDPEFAAAYAEKSFTYFSSFIMPMSRDPKVIAEAVKAAEMAVVLDHTLPLAHARLAWAYFSNHEHAKAVSAARRAVALGPNDAEAHAQLGNILNWSGKPEEGKQYIKRAMRLNPHYPYYYLFYLGQSHYLLEDNDKAIELMKRVVTRAPTFLPVRRHLAVLLTEKGMDDEAAEQTREVLRIFPGASIEDERARCYYRWTPQLMKRFFAGLRKSGMPEGRAGEEPMAM